MLAYSHSYFISKSLEIVQMIIKTFNLYALTNRCRSIATLGTLQAKQLQTNASLGTQPYDIQLHFKPRVHCAGRPAYSLMIALR